MGRPKEKLHIVPRTLWWKRTPRGISLRVSYGIRTLTELADLDVETARTEFRRLHAQHKIERVARDNND